MIHNVNDMQDLDEKSEKIKDSSYQLIQHLILINMKVKLKKNHTKI